MGKKKSSGTKYKSEEEVYEDLQRLMQVWEKKGSQSLFSKRSYLSSIKTDFRSPRICSIVFSNPDVFNVGEEIKYMPLDLMSEEFLIQMVYDYPKLICLRDENGPRVVSIPEEKQTLPILVAFELGKRRYERFSAMQWGRDGEKIPYAGKMREYIDTITNVADKVEDIIGTDNLKHTGNFEDENEKDEFIKDLVEAIQEESSSISLQADERYIQKYPRFDYNSNKKLLVLVSGYPDSGKTSFSHYLAEVINGAMCFDSDQLLERGMLDAKLYHIVRPENKVVIFSDPDAHIYFGSEEIERAMGDTNILNVYMQPSSVKRMFHHSKYRQKGKMDEYTAHFERFQELHSSGFDVTITNDYTRYSMFRCCDDVIEAINKMFGTQEIAKNKSDRKSESDLLEELGLARIEEGASRVEDCELFTSRPAEDIEKQER